MLGPLTDLFAMPGWVPLANVFSIGDVLIGIGAVIAVVAAMHGRGPRRNAHRHSGDHARRRCSATRTDRWCVSALTRPFGRTVRPAHGATGPDAHSSSQERRSLRDGHRPGQTRRESGTQSQGSSFGKTARLPEAIVVTQTNEVVS